MVDSSALDDLDVETGLTGSFPLVRCTVLSAVLRLTEWMAFVGQQACVIAETWIVLER